MQVWSKYTTAEILATLEQELAKCANEVKCAESDIRKIQNRIGFVLTAIHHLKLEI
jgi:hypothetical protein